MTKKVFRDFFFFVGRIYIDCFGYKSQPVNGIMKGRKKSRARKRTGLLIFNDIAGFGQNSFSQGQKERIRKE